MHRHILALDIGSNSVGSAWIDQEAGRITVGTSVFPAGVEESEDKRGVATPWDSAGLTVMKMPPARCA